MTFKDFFNPSESNHSMTRLLTFSLVVLSMLVSIVVVYLGVISQPIVIDNNGIKTIIPPDTNIINSLNYLIITLLGFAFGAKVTQKYGEVSLEKSINALNNKSKNDYVEQKPDKESIVEPKTVEEEK